MSFKYKAILLFFYILFLFYSTLIPFEFEKMSFHQAFQEFLKEKAFFSVGVSWTDVVSNLILFGVYGFLFGVFSPKSFAGPLWVGAGLITGVSLSALIEFLQCFSPARVSTLRDVLVDSIGVLAGLIAGIFFLWVWHRLFSQCIKRAYQANPWLIPLFFYIAYIVFLQFFPFYVSISVSDIWHAVKTAEWIPFSQMPAVHRADYWDSFFQEMASYYILAFLLGKVFFDSREGSLKKMPAVFLCVFFALGVEWVQLAIPARTTSMTEILGALLGAFMGMILMKRRTGVILGIYLWILMGSYLAPFAFNFKERHDFCWIPFYAYFYHTTYWAYLDLMEVFFLWLPFGFLAGAQAAQKGKKFSLIRLGILGFLSAFLLERIQVFIPERTPEITDALISCGAWMVGGRMGRKIKNER